MSENTKAVTVTSGGFPKLRPEVFKDCIEDRGYFQQVLNDLGMDVPLQKTFVHYAVYAAERAKRARRRYTLFTFLSLILPILSSALGFLTFDFNNFSAAQIPGIIGILCSVLTSVSTGLLSTFHYRDTWDRYRWYIEELNTILIGAIGKKSEHATQDEVNAFIAEQLNAVNGVHLKKWSDRKIGNVENK